MSPEVTVPKMNIDLGELLPAHHQMMVENGFWNAPRNKAGAIMRIVTELAEALDAGMKGHHLSAQDVVGFAERSNQLHPISFAGAFQAAIKNTVGDELADAYLRTGDLAAGFDCNLELLKAGRMSTYLTPLHCWSEDFGENLLYISSRLYIASKSLDVGYSLGIVLGLLENLCYEMNVPLVLHIELKMRYNRTRPRLHGKTTA